MCRDFLANYSPLLFDSQLSLGQTAVTILSRFFFLMKSRVSWL